MSELKIELLGRPVLRQKAAEVTDIDDELRELIKNMFDTMYIAEGIGLAAPQVGVAKRVFVADLKNEKDPKFALINPRIVSTSKEREKGEEGCLSIPGVSALVDRPMTVVVEGLDEKGEPLRIEADGLLARCIQHEMDHLDGVLFIDHLSPLKRSMLMKKYKALLAEDAAAAQEKTPARRSG
jgi:peptide deformylase